MGEGGLAGLVLVVEVAVAGRALDRREAGRGGLGAGDDHHVVIFIGVVAQAVAAFVVVLVDAAFRACVLGVGRGVGIFILLGLKSGT